MYDDFFYGIDYWSSEEEIEENRRCYWAEMERQAEEIWRETMAKYNTIPETVGA